MWRKFGFALAIVVLAVALDIQWLQYSSIGERLFGLRQPVSPWHPHNQHIGQARPPIYVYTAEELFEYRGLPGQPGCWLSILGRIYDVQEGIAHYGPEGNYHGMAGRDVSVGFHTGTFTPDPATGQTWDDMTDVLTLSRANLHSVEKFHDFYRQRYTHVGYLAGRFYTSNGDPTDYTDRVLAELAAHAETLREQARIELAFPPCNMESANGQTRFWCSDRSGGQQRSWSGLPMRFYEPGEQWRCACVLPGSEEAKSSLLEKFPNCEEDESSCTEATSSD